MSRENRGSLCFFATLLTLLRCGRMKDMSFKFAVRPASNADVHDIFTLLKKENLITGTLEDLSNEILGMGNSTYWVAARDGIFLGVLRSSALGPGLPRMIAIDRIAFSSALLRGELEFSPSLVAEILCDRALGDVPAFAIANDSQVQRQAQAEEQAQAEPSVLAIISKILLKKNFLPMGKIAENLGEILSRQLGEHIYDGQVFVR